MVPHSAFTSECSRLADRLFSKVILINGATRGDFDALWDTGANTSCISHDVVQALGLVATGRVPIHTPSGTRVSRTYLVDIQLPNNVIVHGVQVCDSEIGGQGIGVLIGMNIINQGDFAVSNFQGKTVFTFRCPSVAKADYVKELNRQKVIGTHGPGKRKKKHK